MLLAGAKGDEGGSFGGAEVRVSGRTNSDSSTGDAQQVIHLVCVRRILLARSKDRHSERTEYSVCSSTQSISTQISTAKSASDWNLMTEPALDDRRRNRRFPGLISPSASIACWRHLIFIEGPRLQSYPRAGLAASILQSLLSFATRQSESLRRCQPI